MEEFVRERRRLEYLTKMEGVDHPAQWLLRQYKLKRSPIKFRDVCWDRNKIQVVL